MWRRRTEMAGRGERARRALGAVTLALGLGGGAAWAAPVAAEGSPFGSPLAAAEVRVCGAPATPVRPPEGLGRFQPGAVDAGAPWMAKLEVLEQVGPDGSMTVSNCGATALNGRWLVTAAHCVGSAEWLRVRATLGARDLDDRHAVRREAEVALCHARFDPETLSHDVALVRLSRPLPEGFPTLRLASAEEGASLRSGHRALSAGWSRLSAETLSSVLRRTQVRVVDPGRAADGFIVAAPERDEGSLCVGESGGPLVADLGRGPALVGVFSSVDAYVDRRTGELVELCDGFEARSYFTPTAGLADWAGAAIAACEADLAACRGRRQRAASMRTTNWR